MSSFSASFRFPRSADLPARKRYILAGATAMYVLLVALEFFHMKATSPLDALPSLILALAPLLCYAFVRSPLIFPFCAYVLALPFDTISRISSAGTLAKFLGIACAIAIVANLLQSKRGINPPRALGAWSCLVCWMFATQFWAINQSDASTALAMYAGLVGLYAVIAFVRATKFELDTVLVAVVSAGVISAGYGAYLFLSGQHLLKGTTRVLLVVGNAQIDPNDWAASLILPIAIALHWLLNARSPIIRAAMLPTLAILFAGLAATGSRGGMLSVLTVFVLLCIRSRHRVTVFSALAASVAFALAANPGIVGRFQSAQSDGGAGRADIWRIGLHALSGHWVLGVGVGNFPDAYDEAYLHVVTRHYLGWHWAPHNVALGIATELGVVGFVLWIVCLRYQMHVLHLINRRHELYDLRLAIEGAFLGGIVSGLSLGNLNAKYIWLTFSIMLILRGYAIVQPQQVSEYRSPVERRPRAVLKSAAASRATAG